MRLILGVLQWICIAIVGAGLLTQFVDFEVREGIDPKRSFTLSGGYMAYRPANLAAPFVHTQFTNPIRVTGAANASDGAVTACPFASDAAVTRQEACFFDDGVQFLFYQSSLLSAGSTNVTSIVLPVRVSPVLIGIAAFLAGAAFVWRRLATTPSEHGIAAGLFIAATGGTLLGLSFIGLEWGDRSVEVGTEAPRGAVTLSYRDFVIQSKREPGEDALGYALRLNNAISRAMIETPPDGGRFQLSFAAHWPLRLIGEVNQTFLNYVYWDPYRAVHRGRGNSGQVASIFVGIGQQNGLNARILNLLGYIIATAEVQPGVWHVFDPDFGLHLPYDRQTLEANADLLRRTYETAPAWASAKPGLRAAILEAYATTANNSVDSSGRSAYHSGYRFMGMPQSEFEPLLDRLRFLLPFVLLIVGLALAAFIAWGPRGRTVLAKRPGEGRITPS